MNRTSKQAKDSTNGTDLSQKQVENTTDYEIETKHKLKNPQTFQRGVNVTGKLHLTHLATEYNLKKSPTKNWHTSLFLICDVLN